MSSFDSRRDAWSVNVSNGSKSSSSSEQSQHSAHRSPSDFYILLRWLALGDQSTPSVIVEESQALFRDKLDKWQHIFDGENRTSMQLCSIESPERPHLLGTPYAFPTYFGGDAGLQISAAPIGNTLKPPENRSGQLASLPEKGPKTVPSSSGSITHQTTSGFTRHALSSATSLRSQDAKQQAETRQVAGSLPSVDEATSLKEEGQNSSNIGSESEDEPENSSDRETSTDKCEERLANPIEYFRKLELLEESIYLHSALCFHTSSSSDSSFPMPLPEFEVLRNTDLEMFGILQGEEDPWIDFQPSPIGKHLLHLRNIIFSVYINIMRLKSERYCESFISLLVMDPMRPDHVAKLHRLPISKVKTFVSEFSYYYNSQKFDGADNQLLKYLCGPCCDILSFLGIPSTNYNSDSSAVSYLEKIELSKYPELTAIHLCYSVAYILDLAVISYSGAHIEHFDQTYLGARKESFQIPGQFLVMDEVEEDMSSELTNLIAICFRRRSLQCLDNFLRRDVWVFHPFQNGQQHDKLYLQTDIQTFGDIWGPMWASSLKSNPDEIYEFNVGNGTILPWPPSPDLEKYRIPYNGEVFCHWVSWQEPWTEVELLQGKARKQAIHWGDSLLIGASSNSLELAQSDHCQRSLVEIKQGLKDNQALNPLRTARRDRVKDSQTVAVTAGGLGLTAGASKTYKRRDGQTWKMALVESWRDVEFVNTVSLGYYVGLEVSICTKNSRRVRLLDVLGTKTMRLYLKGRDFRWGEWGKSLEGKYFKALRSPKSFHNLWKIRKYREVLGRAISRCIDALDETGVDEVTGALKALWVVEAEPPDSDIGETSVDGSSSGDHNSSDSGSDCSDDEITLSEEYIMSIFRSEQTWTRFLKDTRDVLTMAVVEDNCLEFNYEHGRLCTSKRLAEDGKLVRWAENGYPVLQTGLEINDLLLEKEGIVKVEAEGTRPYWDVRNAQRTTSFRLGEQGVLEVFENPNSSHSSRKGKAKMISESDHETQSLVAEWHGVKSETLRELRDVDIQQTFYGSNPRRHHREYSSTALSTRPIPIFILSDSRKIGHLG